MSLLDSLIGPFIQAAGSLLTKRSTLNFGTGLTAVDNPTEKRTDVTVTTGSYVSRIAWGEKTMMGDTPVEITCAAIAAGDLVMWGVKTAVAQGAAPVVTAVTAGSHFHAVADVNDISTYYYAVLRSGVKPPE